VEKYPPKQGKKHRLEEGEQEELYFSFAEKKERRVAFPDSGGGNRSLRKTESGAVDITPRGRKKTRHRERGRGSGAGHSRGGVLKVAEGKILI